jgi:hypothetical protein
MPNLGASNNVTDAISTTFGSLRLGLAEKFEIDRRRR